MRGGGAVIWLAWRLQRLGLGLAAGLLALLGAYMHATGDGIHAVYPHLSRACAAAGGDGLACSRLSQAVDDWAFPYRTLFTWLQLVPLGFALLAAVPFILQLEQGTFRLVWTQSATRDRWIAAMLGSALLATTVATAGFDLLASWWLQPLDAVQGGLLPGSFELEGVAPIAYGIFALALAVSAGTLLRRSIAAVGIALAGFLLVHVAIAGRVRPHYLPPTRIAWRIGVPQHAYLVRGSDWLIASGISDGRGPIYAPESVNLICPPKIGGELQILTACLRQHRWTDNTVIFQPSAHFWPFQLIESAIYVGMAAILLTVAIWRVRPRPMRSRLHSWVPPWTTIRSPRRARRTGQMAHGTGQDGAGWPRLARGAGTHRLDSRSAEARPRQENTRTGTHPLDTPSRHVDAGNLNGHSSGP